MSDSVNMSLDDIIKQNQQQNRASRTRGRGGGSVRGTGGDRGGVRGRGRGRGRGGVSRGGGSGRGGGGGRGGGRGRGRGVVPRSGTPRRGRSRSRSQQGLRGQSQSRTRSQTRALSRSRQQRRSTSRARSASRSRSRLRGLTPKGRAGLEDQLSRMPHLVRSNSFTPGGRQNKLWRSNSNSNLQSNVHARLGVSYTRGNNIRRPFALSKAGISKRGRRLSTNNRYSSVGLRSDQILREQQQNFLRRNNVIRSQTFTRSRNNSFSSPSQLTVSVANDFVKRRRNSFGNAGYLNKQSLAQLNNQFGGYNTRRGPGSVRSMGSNRSNWSNRSRRSYQSNNSNRSNRSRGRGRGRGANRGIGRKFVNKQILNPKLQKEIAAIQGRSYGSTATTEAPDGINFTPTPAATTQSLHQRFAST